jgi:hypothetical protein
VGTLSLTQEVRGWPPGFAGMSVCVT